MMTKKNVLSIGLGALTLFILIGLVQTKYGLDCSYQTNKQNSGFGGYIPGGNGEAYPDIIYFERAEWCEPLALTLVAFFPILLLSLITYRMHDSVFRAWWNFARWFVPIIIITTIFFETRRSGGGGWGISSGLDEFVILSLLYIILIFTSIWKILGAHDKLKKK